MDLLGYLDVALGRYLLGDDARREDREQIVGTGRLQGRRVQGRRRRLGQVRDDVVPGLGDPLLVKDELLLVLAHDLPPLG